jgi:hypothetical protein
VSATFDATTKAAYDAATTAQARAAAIVASLTGTISVKVFDGDDAEMGSGTMASPWATAVSGVVVLGEVTEFTVGTTGTPDANWYIRFENSDASRWVRGSFGLSGSGQDYTWSLATWTEDQTGTIGTATIVAAGNAAPVFTVAPTTASIAATGGTIQFTAVDPEGSEVVYSLTTTRSGITINSTGLVTVTAAAAGTSGNIVVQASDGILTASATCAVAVFDAMDWKWHPGHYAAPDSVLLASSIAAHTTLWNQIASVDNFVGGEMYVPWGQLEPTTAGNYTFDLIEGQIAALAALGKKAIINVWAHRYGTTSTGGGYHPQYLIDSGDVVGFTDANGTSVSEVCLWRSYVADRYIALFAALADTYNDDERVAAINTCETAFLNPGGDFSGSALLTQWRRIAAYLPTAFTRTPTFVKANFLVTQTDMANLMQACVDAGAGMGGPDMFPIEFSGTTDNWGQRCLRGERYSASAWVPGVAPNQQAAIPVLMEQQVVRSTSATPAMYYNAAVTRYSCTHVTWQAKTTAFLYGSGGATPVPAMNWSNVLAYVRDNSLPLRTNVPTALS